MAQAVDISEVEKAQERLAQVQRQVSRVYMGATTPIELCLIALLARGHCLLEGVPGVAKTTLVKAFAKTLGCSVRRIQFTPDLLPADITGTYVLNPKEGTFSMRAGPIFANLVLADEINRAPAKTQSALLEAMQEQQVTIEGERFGLPDPFFVLATQNPVDLEGTYPLPEAQIDRFLVRIPLGYPSHQSEVAMLKAHGVVAQKAESVLGPEETLRLQSVAARVHVEDDLMDYAVRLTAHTRRHPQVVLGASPRASLGLLRAAKSHAVLRGRPYLTPDDVQFVAEPVLSHRLIVTPELEEDPDSRSRIVRETLHQVSYQKGLHEG